MLNERDKSLSVRVNNNVLPKDKSYELWLLADGVAGQNPFSVYMDMFNAGMQMTELFNSSAQVIAHRSNMISQAIKGEIPLHHKEFTDMWMEKFFAGGATMTAAMKYLGSACPGTTIPLPALMRIMAPIRKRQRAMLND